MDEFLHLSQSLAEFVEQPDTPCLLLMTSDQDTLFPVKQLLSMDREDPYTVYLVFAHPCPDVDAYMDAVAEHVRIQLEGIDARAQTAGGAPIGPLPAAVLDRRERPCDRLVALIEHVRAQLDEETVVVWALLPSTLADPDGFRELTRPLVPLDGVGERDPADHFIIRERLDASIWARELHERCLDDALVYRFEASLAQALDELGAVVAHPSRPDDERMNALMQLAGIDVAGRRLPDALEKYDALRRYYGATDRSGMLALALGGSGDALRLAERHEEALARYREGLAVSVPAGAWPPTLTLLMCAGEACMRLDDWAEAEGYFGLAIDVATKLVNLHARCDAQEKRGLARSEQGDHRGAVEDWVITKGLSKRYRYDARFHSAIDRLIETYRAADLPEQVEKLEAEKAAGARGLAEA